jgi:hypothetical protein
MDGEKLNIYCGILWKFTKISGSFWILTTRKETMDNFAEQGENDFWNY